MFRCLLLKPFFLFIEADEVVLDAADQGPVLIVPAAVDPTVPVDLLLAASDPLIGGPVGPVVALLVSRSYSAFRHHLVGRMSFDLRDGNGFRASPQDNVREDLSSSSPIVP